MNDKEEKFIVLSCGGTGGHMTPAQALGHDLMRRGYRVEVMTDQRGMRYAPMFEGMKMHVLPAATLGAGLKGKLFGVLRIMHGVAKAAMYFLKNRPAIVAGFGGYPSVPAMLAAQILGIPTIIHEQNAIIGKANAWLAPRAKRIALSLPKVQGLSAEEMSRSVVSGNPVRAEIAALSSNSYMAPKDGEDLNLLVVGGSLGATVFSDVMPEAINKLPAEYKSRLRITQQCRPEDVARTQAAYDTQKIKAECAEFITDMAAALAGAHLVIARSGAGMVAELTAAGRPAIFVPYPHHKDQQQKMNADAVADHGGAWVMTEASFTPDTVSTRLETFFQDLDILSRAAKQSQACGNPTAAQNLGDLVASLIGGSQLKQSSEIAE